MIVCDTNKFIFIHIPKNSGTEMTKQLRKTYKNTETLVGVDFSGDLKNRGIDKMHLYYDVIDRYISIDKFDNYFKFCIIRNPYNKIYSAWRYICKGRRRQYNNDVNDFIKYKLTEEFMYGRQSNPRDERVHYRPQYTFLYDNKNNKYADFVIRYESLNEDISKMNEQFDLKIPLYDNGNTNKSYIKHLNKESIQKINSLYKKDFELLNYEMI